TAPRERADGDGQGTGHELPFRTSASPLGSPTFGERTRVLRKANSRPEQRLEYPDRHHYSSVERAIDHHRSPGSGRAGSLWNHYWLPRRQRDSDATGSEPGPGSGVTMDDEEENNLDNVMLVT